MTRFGGGGAPMWSGAPLWSLHGALVGFYHRVGVQINIKHALLLALSLILHVGVGDSYALA